MQSNVIVRTAKLFEAGEYEDKGVTVTESDLDSLVDNFSEPAPIQIEHQDQPLQLGFVTKIWRCGKDLMGKLELNSEANALIEKSGAKRLSAAMTRDFRRLLEVSLVKTPRVASAQMFNQSLTFCIPFIGFKDEHSQAIKRSQVVLEQQLQDAIERAETAEKRLKALGEAHHHSETETLLARYKQMGKLTPCTETFARAILNSDSLVTFSGEETSIRALFIKFLDKQPEIAIFRETAQSADDKDDAGVPMETASYYKRHFPGLAMKDIMKYAKERR